MMLLFEAAWVSRWLTKQSAVCAKEMRWKERWRKKGGRRRIRVARKERVGSRRS